MKTSLLILLLSPFILFCQTQIGADIDGEFAGDLSGISVSLSSNGSIVAIGAINNNSETGHVRVFENVSGVWTQVGADIDGEAIGDRSGEVSLSSDGSIVAIGALLNDGNGTDSGHVRVYENISGVWTQIGADIDGEAADDLSGISVSLSADGSTVAIGADSNSANGTFSGHVRVYENISGVWTQIGADIDGEAAGDLSGASISLSADGSIVAIGAEENDGNGVDSGHVRVYENVSGVWTQIGVDIDGEAMGDYSGLYVSLSGDGSTVAIGAGYNSGSALDSGHVRVYENISGVWTQIGADIDGEALEDYSGSVSLSVDGSIVAIGAAENDGNGTDSGHVRIFTNIAGVWTQIGSDIDGEVPGDFSGDVISLSADGNTLAIGASDNDGNGTDSGHVRVYDLSTVLSTQSFSAPQVLIYPNPANETLYVQLNQKSNYSIIDVFGKTIQTGQAEQGDNAWSVKNFEAGMYFLSLANASGSVVKKVIIQ